MQVELPEDLAGLLGAEPSRAVLEALLLQLVHDEKMTVARAGELLGKDREEAISWYTSHGYHYASLSPEEAQRDLDTLKALGG